MNRLRELRLSRNLKQSELGELLGVQKSAISKYETEKRALTDDLIEKICEIFNVTSDYLLCRTTESKVLSARHENKPPIIAGYDQLTPANKLVIDQLVESLLKAQSDV